MIVGVVATAVSVYYYLAVVRALYMRSAAELRSRPAGGSPPRELAAPGLRRRAASAVTVASFFAVEPLDRPGARTRPRSLPF